MMLTERQPIKVETAVERVMSAVYENSLQIEEIPFEKSYGRILAENLIATHPVPPFSKSPYDGFAIKASDTQNASLENRVTFSVVEHVGAGSRARRAIEKGEAVRIMTGAEIPAGADCVVMLEVCETYKENEKEKMLLGTRMGQGENIIRKGSETDKGNLLASAGVKINPGLQALLATFGYAKVKVYRKPVVGIYATGSELLDVDQPLEPGKIRNSNAFMIAAQIERAGGKPLYLGKLVDELEVSFQAIQKALESVDVLVTTGGVSVGDYDLLPDIYKELEADILFNKVAMRPGSVTTVAKKGKKLLFGLSGNPSACYVGFELFTRPYINKLMGKKDPFVKSIQAELDVDFPKANPFARFVRSKIFFQEGKVKIKPVGIDKSGVVTSLAETNALMVLPGGSEGYHRNHQVEGLLLEGNEGMETFTVTSLTD